MRTIFLGLALAVTCLAEPAPVLEVVVPPAAAHPQDWLHPPKIVVDQYAGPADDVRRYLTAMPTAVAQYFGPSLELCLPRANPNSANGVGLAWTSTSAITFESGRSGRLAVATVFVAKVAGPKLGLSRAPSCLGIDKVPIDSLYVSYVGPDGYSWAFAVPLHRKK